MPKTSKMLPSPSLKIHIAFEAQPRLSLEIFWAPLPRINLEVNNNPLFEVSLKIQGISRWKLFRGSLKEKYFFTPFLQPFSCYLCTFFEVFRGILEKPRKNCTNSPKMIEKWVMFFKDPRKSFNLEILQISRLTLRPGSLWTLRLMRGKGRYRILRVKRGWASKTM